jgi:hypothetical protein
MEALNIREKLHHFIDTIEDKKAEAIYTLFEDEIEKMIGNIQKNSELNLTNATNIIKVAVKW